YKDAKSLWEAIKNMFGGNKESNKMQKTILELNYENFAVSSQEGIDKTYDRFQKLISQLEIHGDVILQEDANLNVSDVSFKDQASNASYADDVMFSFFSNQSNAPQLDNKDLEQIDIDDLEEIDFKWRGHFARECRTPRDQGNRNRDALTRNAPVDTSTTNALVVQDMIGGYDWSFQAKEKLTNFALMAYTSQGSSSSLSSDSKVYT
nr:ribonuclease H-like domain-containing protein [Tanacetum cinerariifolium]